MMVLMAIDPGTEKSGVVWLEGGAVELAAVIPNDEVLKYCRDGTSPIVIEMISGQGMPVGQETFETVYWIGRFCEAANGRATRIYRRYVKLHHCHSARAKDANIWQAIKDRFGGESAVGTKKQPGPLYGVKSHCRQALALGLAWIDGVRSDGLSDKPTG